MLIQSNTERFIALKKLSELKAEYHKRKLMENIPFSESFNADDSQLKNYVGMAQLVINLIGVFNNK